MSNSITATARVESNQHGPFLVIPKNPEGGFPKFDLKLYPGKSYTGPVLHDGDTVTDTFEYEKGEKGNYLVAIGGVRVSSSAGGGAGFSSSTQGSGPAPSDVSELMGALRKTFEFLMHLDKKLDRLLGEPVAAKSGWADDSARATLEAGFGATEEVA